MTIQQRYDEVFKIEKEELRDALKKVGGEIHFEEPVYVAVNCYEETQDAAVMAAKIDEDGYVKLLIRLKDCSDTETVSMNKVEYGHLNFITSSIHANVA